MSPMWSGKSAMVEAAMKNMLAASTQTLLDQWEPLDDEDFERKEQCQQDLDDLDRTGEPPPEDSPPEKGKSSKHKTDKKAAKALHERVLFYKTESERKRRLNAIRRPNNGFAHAGTVDGYMQGQHLRQIGAPPHSPTDESHNPHHFPPHPEPKKRGFFGGLFKSNKKKLHPPSPPVMPHEGSLDSYEERHPRQGPSSPVQDAHHSPYHQEPASPSKLLKRHGSTSSKRGHDTYSSPQMHVRATSGGGGEHYDRPHRSSSSRHRDRDRDRDRDRERDRGTDPSRGSSRRYEKSHSYDERKYPPSSRRDIGSSDKHGYSRHHEGSREREHSSRHRDDDRHGSSHRRRSSHRRYDEEDEDAYRRRRRDRERREHDKDRERDRDHDKRRRDDLQERPRSVHDQALSREGSHHGDHGGDFHDAPSVHESEHKHRDDPDALSVSDHLNGGLHVSG